MISLSSHPGTTSDRGNVRAETKIPKDDKVFSNYQENGGGTLSVVNSVVSIVILDQYCK